MEGNRKMKLAVQSGLLRLFPLELAVEKIRAAGYDGIELWGGQFHGYIMDLLKLSDNRYQVDKAQVQAVKDVCNRGGLPVVCYTPEQLIYPVNYLAPDVAPFDAATVRDRSRELVHRCIDVAHLLGCNQMVLVTQFWQWRKVGGEYVRVTKSEARDESIREIERFVAYAETQGVALLLEPLVYHDSNGIVTLEDIQVMMDRIASPSLKLMLDTGHIQVTAIKEGYQPLEYLRRHLDRYADRLGYVHVDDNSGPVDSHLALGEGTIDFAGMFRLFDEYGYTGWYSLELGILGDYALPENAVALLQRSKAFLDRVVA